MNTTGDLFPVFGSHSLAAAHSKPKAGLYSLFDLHSLCVSGLQMSNKRKLSKLAKEENQTNVASGAPSDSNVSPSQVSFTVSIDKAIKVDLTEKRVKKVQGNKVPTVPALNEEQKQLLHTNLCNTMNPAFYLVFSHTNVTAFVAVINSNADHRSRVPSYIMSSPATETNPLTAEYVE